MAPTMPGTTKTGGSGREWDTDERGPARGGAVPGSAPRRGRGGARGGADHNNGEVGEEEETRAGPTAGAARKGNGSRGTRRGTRSSRSQQTTCRSFPRSYPAISAEKKRGFHRAALAGACLNGSCQLSRGCYHGVSKLPPYDAMDEFEGQGGCWLCLSYWIRSNLSLPADSRRIC